MREAELFERLKGAREVEVQEVLKERDYLKQAYEKDMLYFGLEIELPRINDDLTEEIEKIPGVSENLAYLFDKGEGASRVLYVFEVKNPKNPEKAVELKREVSRKERKFAKENGHHIISRTFFRPEFYGLIA